MRNGHWRSQPLPGESTEANLVCLAALADDPPTQDLIRNWLNQEAWLAEERCFRAAKGDPAPALAPIALGIAVLGPAQRGMLACAEERLLRRHAIPNRTVAVQGFADAPDRRCISYPGTAQLALAYQLAGQTAEGNLYLVELEDAMQPSRFTGAAGLPAASVRADAKRRAGPICTAAQAWYLLASWGINPLAN
jgi:hypothetical protein